MNLRQLRSFLRVVELKSFTLAAEQLHLTQPAVSFHIQSLEEEFGVELLDRSGREIIPTSSGGILYDYARRILDLYAESKIEIDRLHNLMRGRLVIGASTGPGEHVLPTLLGRFKAQYPQIEVVLRISRTEEIIHQVLERTLEIGIVGAKMQNEALSFEPFIKDELIVIASPDHRWADGDLVDLTELLKEPFILQQEGAGVRTMLGAGLTQRGLSLNDLNVYMELGLQESVKSAVTESFGVGIISRFAVRQELAIGTLVEIPIRDWPVFRDQFYLVRNHNRKMSHLIEAFISFARDQIEPLNSHPTT
jgi:DNA-binding transcriptional LysR family regulator